MNVFLREMKANRKALVIWSVCMFLLVLSGMGKYTAYSSGGASSDIFNKMPLSLKVLFGMGSFDVTSIGGYFAFLFPYLEITAAIHAALLGSSVIAKEERDKTTEFLMVKPLPRTAILTSKLLTALFNLEILNAVTLLSSLGMVAIYGKGTDVSREIVLMMVSMFLVQLIFLSLGIFLSSYLKKPKASGSITTGILLGAFVLSKVTDFSKKLDLLNVLSPFKYFSLEDMVYKNFINIGIIGMSLILAAGLICFAYYFYQRRDLNV